MFGAINSLGEGECELEGSGYVVNGTQEIVGIRVEQATSVS